ncbi:hypothetical protein ACLB1G_21285 [Oxalobacteraceae bacterium A2-2]
MALPITPLAGAASLASVATISFAEQPPRLLRGTSFYSATRGVHLENGDIVDTGAGGIQIEGVAGAILALGPSSRVYFKLTPGESELQLLSGWLKVQPARAPGGHPPTVISGAVKFSSNASVIVHDDAGVIEVFVEDGDAAITESAIGKPPRTIRMAREQYAAGSPAAPFKVLARPSKEFLAGLPPPFLDRLVPVNLKGYAAEPKQDGPASYAQVLPWLTDVPALRQLLQRRFNPVATKSPAATRR